MPVPHNADRHALYRFYGETGQLLYAGISNDPGRRFGQHGATKSWWPTVRGITLEWYSSRRDALAAEARVIEVERPLFNVQRPAMQPPPIERCQHCEQPLARVAHAAGGAWPAVVARMAAADVENVRRDREDGLARQRPHVLLLRHVQEVWPDGVEFVRTDALVASLVAAVPEVWGAESPYGKALTSQRLGRMLVDHYGIRAVPENSADKNSKRGYRRRQFGDVARARQYGIPWQAIPHHLGTTPEAARKWYERGQ